MNCLNLGQSRATGSRSHPAAGSHATKYQLGVWTGDLLGPRDQAHEERNVCTAETLYCGQADQHTSAHAVLATYCALSCFGSVQRALEPVKH